MSTFAILIEEIKQLIVELEELRHHLADQRDRIGAEIILLEQKIAQNFEQIITLQAVVESPRNAISGEYNPQSSPHEQSLAQLHKELRHWQQQIDVLTPIWNTVYADRESAATAIHYTHSVLGDPDHTEPQLLALRQDLQHLYDSVYEALINPTYPPLDVA